MIDLNTNIQFIKGVGEKRAQLLNKLGIFDIHTLLSFYPRAYEDWSRTKSASDVPENETCCIRAVLASPVTEHLVKKGMTLYKCAFTDGASLIHVTLFNNRFLAQSLELYEEYLLFGKIQKTFTSISMTSPRIEKAKDAQRIHPVYPTTANLSSKAIEKVVHNALDMLPPLPETLDEEILTQYRLMGLNEAIREIHSPSASDSLEKAKKRLIFEELLVLQLGLIKLKGRGKKENYIVLQKEYTDDFISLLPFEPTSAQVRVIRECVRDMMGAVPMNRLIQGDVGSGKTACAAGVIYSMVKNTYQCAFMAPTEILAAQHFATFCTLLEPAGIRIALLTGSTPAAQKRTIKAGLMEGMIDLIIGTHALIQNDVEFQNLGLVVTDEQHRFGVEQRAMLAEKGRNPHLLVMSATPIPRTLGLIIYGDLDISILDELPRGRQKIDTLCVPSSYHPRIYKFIRKNVSMGNQAYIVCPLVDESESELTSAKKYAQELSAREFSGYTVGILHGKMKPKDKEAVMSDFSSNKTQILVATTVIEVGVDVPNATVMLIENADRFGLSQLHQLRGRVGRGSDKSYCILINDNKGAQAVQRMQIMKRTNDGFVIADEDLKMRGPGDFFGKRQHGLPELKIADMLTDMEILRQAQACAKEILKTDFELQQPHHKALAKSVQSLFEQTVTA